MSATLGYAARRTSACRPARRHPPCSRHEQAVSERRTHAAERQGVAVGGQARRSRGLRATLSAARQKEAVDCAGDNAAESAAAAIVAERRTAAGGSLVERRQLERVRERRADGSTSDTQASSGDAMKVQSDRASLASAEAALAGAEASCPRRARRPRTTARARRSRCCRRSAR